MVERKNSAARIKTNNKWTNAHYDRINIAVPKGQKEVIQAAAAQRNESVNGFINRLIDAELTRLDGDTPIGEGSGSFTRKQVDNGIRRSISPTAPDSTPAQTADQTEQDV